MFPFAEDRAIVSLRPLRNAVDFNRHYAFMCELEHSTDGTIDNVATIFLTNRECPFHCLMCDLWRNTTETSIPVGSVPVQIDVALTELGGEILRSARHLKLYNSGNFFDSKAILRADWPAIVERARSFKTVIVENHPKLCGSACLEFRDLLSEHDVQLEIAVGLETVHPDVLPRLNKQMTLDDFARAVHFLVEAGISVRSFVLLRPPFLTEAEGVEWALKSLDFAFDQGVNCCAVIPTRAGNGIMDQLADQGLFEPPELISMESVLERSLTAARGRVFIDLLDARQFATCDACADLRIARLNRMNLSQQLEAPIECERCGHSGYSSR